MPQSEKSEGEDEEGEEPLKVTTKEDLDEYSRKPIFV
jgi:hypothetical protein